MRLINKTNHNSKEMKEFLQKTLKHEGVKHSEYVIHLVNRRGGYFNLSGIRGYAYLSKIHWEKFKIKGKYYIKMKLPCKLDFTHFYQVLAHEIAHTRGLRHSEMINYKQLEVPLFAKHFDAEDPPIKEFESMEEREKEFDQLCSANGYDQEEMI